MVGAHGVIALLFLLACSRTSLVGNDAGSPPDSSTLLDAPDAPDADASPQGIDADASPQGIDADASPQGIDADASPQGIDADASPQGIDASPPDVGRDGAFDVTVLPTGRRSFVVTSTLTPQPGGMGVVPLPASHTFTMVLDWDGRTAIIGSKDGAGAGGFQPSADGGAIGQIGSFRFGTATMGYQSMALTIDAAGKLSGTGKGMGTALPPNTDVGIYTVSFSVSLAGVPDVQWPGFDSTAFGPTPLDAFASLTIVATEPMPIDTRLALVDGRGNRVELAPLAAQGGAVFSFQPSPFKMWRYGEQYSIAFDGLVDFRGQRLPARRRCEVDDRRGASAGRRGRLRIGDRYHAGGRPGADGKRDPHHHRHAEHVRPATAGGVHEWTGPDDAVRVARRDRSRRHRASLFRTARSTRTRTSSGARIC